MINALESDCVDANSDNVNTFYNGVHTPVQFIFHRLQKPNMPEQELDHSTHQIRRSNLLVLLREFTELKLSQGHPAKGIEGQFADHVGVSPVTLSHIKASRNISDKLANQLEAQMRKSAGWLSAPNRDLSPTQAQIAFVELAVRAWQACNASERRALMRLARQGFQVAAQVQVL